MKTSVLLLVVVLLVLPLWTQQQTCTEQGRTRIEMVTPNAGYVLICTTNRTELSDNLEWFQVLDSTWNIFGAEHVCSEAGLGSSGAWATAALDQTMMNGMCLYCPKRRQCDIQDVRSCEGHPAYVICNLSVSQLEDTLIECNLTQDVQYDATLSPEIGTTLLTAPAIASVPYQSVNITSTPAIAITSTYYFSEDDGTSTSAIDEAILYPSSMMDDLDSTQITDPSPPFTTVMLTSISTVSALCNLPNTTAISVTSSPAPATSIVIMTTTSIAVVPTCVPSPPITRFITMSMSCAAASSTSHTIDTSAVTNMAVGITMTSAISPVSTVTTVTNMPITPQSTIPSHEMDPSLTFVSSSISSSSTMAVSVDSGKLDQCASLGAVLGAMIAAMAVVILGMLIGWIWTCNRKSRGWPKTKKKPSFLGMYASINGLHRRRAAATLPSTSSILPVMPTALDREDSISSSALYAVIPEHRDGTETSREEEEGQVSVNNHNEVVYHVLQPEAGRIRECSVVSDISQSEQPQDYEIPLKIKITPPSEEKEDEALKL